MNNHTALTNTENEKILAVVGSRTIKDYEKIFTILDSIAREKSITTILSGGAIGVDTIAKWFSVRNNLKYMEIPVTPEEWKLYGKSAGHKRNYKIVKTCHLLVAFWDGKSNGTSGTIEMAKQQGKLLEVFLMEPTKELTVIDRLKIKKQINFLNVQANFKSFLLDWCKAYDQQSHKAFCRPSLLDALIQPDCIVDPESKTTIQVSKTFDKTGLISHREEITMAVEALKVQYRKEIEERKPKSRAAAVQEVLF